MEMLLSFVAGFVLAGIVAFFVLRSVKSSATDALTKALDDAAKQAETDKKATIAALEADLKNAKDNLEQAKSDAEKHTQELLNAKDEAHSAYEAVLDKANKGQSVLSSAKKLVKLGAKSSSVHPLPQYEENNDYSDITALPTAE